MQPHLSFGEQAERPGAGGGERGSADGVALLDCSCGVDLVAEDDDAAYVSQPRACCRDDGGVQVGGPVGAGQRWVAHGSGEHDGRGALVQQVEVEGGLLDGAGALDDHYAVHGPGVELGLDRGVEGVEVGQRQRGAGHSVKVADAQ
jgi:hypothetical protein